MPGNSFRAVLKARGSELVLEALFVVFAVLVALAVDEWNQGRELREQAQMARGAVISEVESNWDELMVGQPSVQAMLERVTQTVRILQRGEEVTETDISGVLPDFSDAAWETARVTGIVSRMDYDWVLETARVYEAQELTLNLQRELFATIGGLAVRDPELERFIEFRGQLVILTLLHEELRQKYRRLLDSTRSEQGAPEPSPPSR